MAGQVLGHYRVLANIGEGGMGVVYRAHDEVLDRDVALKVVKKGTGLDASASQNLLQEARASSALAHPNICTIYEVGETDGELYIAMELIEGKSLHAMSVEVGLPADSVIRYAGQIASFLRWQSPRRRFGPGNPQRKLVRQQRSRSGRRDKAWRRPFIFRRACAN